MTRHKPLQAILAASAIFLGGWGDAPEIATAKQAVTQSLRDPTSAVFGKVWSPQKGIVCGFINGKNGFGAMAGAVPFVQDGQSLYILTNPDMLGNATWSGYCR
jgi:hypothetical protein